MFSNSLSEIRDTLAETLKPNLPAKWKLFPTLTAPSKLTVPAVYFEFTEVANEMGGTALAKGVCAANFQLAIVLPGTITEKAEDAADAAVLDLIFALDSTGEIYWGPSATKEVFSEHGQLGWRIPVSVLVSSLPDAAQTQE